jgi:phosphoribosylaminoimidazole-succinocarboxamide synthase
MNNNAYNAEDVLKLYPSLNGHYQGKVRDYFNFVSADGQELLLMVTSDRISAFDRAITDVPHKGAILNAITQYMFTNTADIVKNPVIDYPDPNIMVVKKLDMVPVEVVVRRYMTGSTETSIWTKYSQGQREMYGHIFKEGIQKNQELEETIITPTTKGKTDIPISCADIVKTDLVNEKLWKEIEKISLQLFARGQALAEKQGLILVDTKFEFGVDPKTGELYLADEVLTPDSSRFWLHESYQRNFNTGKDPEALDKEFVRIWLKNNMKDVYKDPIPNITAETKLLFSQNYMKLHEKITGQEYTKPNNQGTLTNRIGAALKLYI